MKKHLQNIALSVICFLFVVVLNFALLRLLPGDPIAYLTGMDEEGLSAEQYEFYRRELHLDENVFSQFGYYLEDIFDGSLGYSFKKQATVSDLISSRVSATMQISLLATVLSCGLALVWGLASGAKRGLLDKISTPLNVLTNTFPTFLIGICLMIFLCFDARIFPYMGLNSDGVTAGTTEYFFDRLYHLFLPVLTLVIAMTPSRYLLMRNSAQSAMKEKYVLFAMQRGLSPRKIRYGYILPNVVQPYVAMTGITVGASVGGSVIIENLFSIKGMGTLLTEAANSLDYPLMQGVLFVTASVALAAIIVTDVICIVIDPKIRTEGKR